MALGGMAQADFSKHSFDMKDRQIISAKDKIDEQFKDNVLSLTEIKAITEMYKEAVTKEEKKEVKEYIESLLKKDTVHNIGKLKAEIENINPHFGFNDLVKSFDKNSIGKQLLENFGSSIDKILGNDFAVKEKDNIKLVFTELTFGMSKDLINEFKTGEKISQKDIKDAMKFLESKKIFEGTGGEINKLKEAKTILGNSNNPFLKKMQKLVDKMIENYEKLENLKKAKKEKNKDFSKIKDVYKELGIEGHDKQTDKQIFEQAKAKIDKVFDLVNKTDKVDKTTQKKQKPKSKDKANIDKADISAAKKVADKAGVEDKSENEQVSFLRELFPGDDMFSQLMRLIFAIALGIDDNGVFPESNDSSKSVKNLGETVSKNKNILNGRVSVEQIKKLDPKKLNKFYSLMKAESIDTNSSDFWEKLLTGKGLSKTDKLFKLHQSLVGKNGRVLDSNQNIDDFVLKLNNLKLSKTQKKSRK